MTCKDRRGSSLGFAQDDSQDPKSWLTLSCDENMFSSVSMTDLHFSYSQSREWKGQPGQTPFSLPEDTHIVPFTAHWPKHDHRTTLSCKGDLVPSRNQGVLLLIRIKRKLIPEEIQYTSNQQIVII